eukprot:724633-Alexandrium_andersonii.AAC.1
MPASRAASVHTVVKHVLEGLGRPGEALGEALAQVGQEAREQLVDAVRVEGDVEAAEFLGVGVGP